VIEFKCSCGKRLKARPEHAGKTVRCPACDARITVPAPEEPPPSGPDTPVAAVREATAEELAKAQADIPEAEVLEEPPPDDTGGDLEALARAVGPAAQAGGRTSPRPTPPSGKAAPPATRKAARTGAGRKPGRTPAGLPPVNRQNGQKDTHRRNVIIGVAAGAGLLLIILIVIAIVGGRNNAPPPPPPPVYQYQPKRPTGPRPGELFPNVRPTDEGGDTR